MFTRLRHWSHTLFSRLPAAFPGSCALCGMEAIDGLCDGCHGQFLALQPNRCRCCATPMHQTGDTVCGECLRHPPAFDATIAAADYAAPVDRLVLALKFGARLDLAPLFATMMRDALLARQETALPSLLCAVPLGRTRLSERGFNQALEMARPLSRSLGIPLHSRLAIRQRETQAQAQLDPSQRQQNIHHAFSLQTQTMDLVRGAHVGVVDDVMTTGQTMNEFAAMLKRYGAARVTGIVFARTPPQ
ncbi:ComF family protein [Herbaspirillum sp. GCM10030257]|uniref:ComF family protein n=1 Tax=Herbaspirillum sp. GCM10030257 TaxID=3273393 RepID=UPI00361C3C7E